jgi:hypothetical protein
MQILKNKHMILAMFVAPVLAIIAYFSVDYMVTEKPQAALQGGTYKLVAKSNCRYQSGACTLENGDIRMQIRAQRISDEMIELNMYSELPIQQALIAYVTENNISEPALMEAATAKMKNWHVTLHLTEPEKTKLRLALSIADSMYYAETTAVFVDYKTSFSRENFSQ